MHSLFQLPRQRAKEIADLALSQVARSWALLSPEFVQAAVGVGHGRWAVAVARLSTDPSSNVRLSLARLVADAGDADLGHVVVSMLHDQDSQVADQAEESLLTLALAAVRDTLKASDASGLISGVPTTKLGRGVQVSLEGSVNQLLADCVEGAMTFAEHRRRAPVTAAVMLASRNLLRQGTQGGQIATGWLNNAQHPSHSALRSAIRWSNAPLVRLRAMEWLTKDHLRIACADRLSRATSLLEHEAVLADAHLLSRPLRRSRLSPAKLPASSKVPGKKKGDGGTLPTAGQVKLLSEAARAGLTRFVAAHQAGAPARRAVLEPLLSDPSSLVRYSLISTLPRTGVADLCFDRDMRVSRSAMVRWSNAGAASEAGVGDDRVLGHLSRSPDAAVRAWAAQDRDLYSAAGHASPSARLAAYRWLASDPAAMIQELRKRLTDPQIANATLLLIRSVGLVRHLETEIVQIATGQQPADERLVATAAAMLADLSGAAARQSADALLTHPIPRVRANAVEAVAKQNAGQSRLPSQIIELKNDDYHRVRANAVRACNELQPDGDSLASMLTDARPMHRLAGVWLASRTLPSRGRSRFARRWPQFASRIAEMARFDDDQRVRARATACAQRLDADLRSAWQINPGAAA